jgi:hypothetical protein
LLIYFSYNIENKRAMEKEFVPFELAVKLKELGFNEPCWGYYHVNEGYSIGYAFCYSDAESQPEIGYLAPTFSQAFRWFREKYDLYHNIDKHGYWFFEIKKDEGYGDLTVVDCCFDFESYEEAELACLVKLIDIVKQKHN